MTSHWSSLIDLEVFLPWLQLHVLPPLVLPPDLSSRSIRVSLGREYFSVSRTKTLPAPFEITKIAAQTSEMLAKGNKSSISDALKDPIRSSYQQKGTIKTAINILKLHGFLGLYAGFRIHIGKAIRSSWVTLCRLTILSSQRYDRLCNILFDLRKHQADARQAPRQ